MGGSWRLKVIRICVQCSSQIQKIEFHYNVFVAFSTFSSIVASYTDQFRNTTGVAGVATGDDENVDVVDHDLYTLR